MHVGVEPRLFPRALTEVGIQSREFGELEINHAAAPAGPSSTRRTISMPRLTTIDKSVIDQINAGNVGVANFLQRLPRGSKLRMSAECFSQLNEAEQRLATDLGVDHPNSDGYYLANLRQRGHSRLRYPRA
jgi:hypothetical protein